MPYRDANLLVKNVRIYVDTPMQGIHLDYTHLTDSAAQSGSLLSFHDGTKTSFRAKDTDDTNVYPLNTPIPFTYTLAPFRSGMSILAATVEYRGNTGIVYNYRVEVVFMWSPFYENILTYQNSVTPDYLIGAKSLTDAFQVVGQPVYNNPNVSVKNNPKETFHKGNVGYFNENFNQLPNVFTFSPVTYTDLLGNTVAQLDYANPVTVKTTISGINNLTYGLTKFQYGFQWVNINEDEEDQTGFKKNDWPYHENTKISTGGQGAILNDVFTLFNGVHSPFPLIREGYSNDGAAMGASDIIFNINPNGTDVDVSITFRPNPAFAAFMDELAPNQRQYVLWISVGDHVPETNKSDRVSLLIEPLNEMKTFVPPIGEYPGLTIDFLDHPQDYDAIPIPCGNEIFVEDDILSKVSFRVDTATAPDIPIPQKIAFGVLVQRVSDGFQYTLDENQADLTQFPNPTQYAFDQPRNFKYGVGNTKNWFKVEYDATNDSGTEKGVKGWYGWKCRYEDWIKRAPGLITSM
jgi:hypothetical protein